MQYLWLVVLQKTSLTSTPKQSKQSFDTLKALEIEESCMAEKKNFALKGI